MQAAGFRLGIDFGTSHTVAVLRWPDGRAKPLLFDGSPLLPSAVYVDVPGEAVVGRDALDSARMHPSRLEPNPKRRIDEGQVLLGDHEVPVANLIGAVLGRVVAEARRTAGARPAVVTLTCPAAWGAPRQRVLLAAAERAGLGDVRMVEEPVAAATYFAGVLGHGMPVGSAVVVYDFGAGTFDVSLIERTGGGFRTRAVGGRDDIGGLDLDQAIVQRIGEVYGPQDPDGWQRLMQPATRHERRQHRLFRDDVRNAKERLSRYPAADLHIAGLDRDAHLTREEFEQLARPILAETVRVTAQVAGHGGFPRERIAGVFLVGGTSRIPLIATLIHHGLQIPPTVIEQPELVVAEGSILVQSTVAVTRASGPDVGTTPAGSRPEPGAFPGAVSQVRGGPSAGAAVAHGDADAWPAHPHRQTAQPHQEPAQPHRLTAQPHPEPAQPQTAQPHREPVQTQRLTAQPHPEPAQPQTAQPHPQSAHPQSAHPQPQPPRDRAPQPVSTIRRRPSRRWILTGTALVLVAAVLVALAAQRLRPDGKQPAAVPEVCRLAARATGTQPLAPGTPVTYAVPMPAGWREHVDPSGFRIAFPPEWRRFTDGVCFGHRRESRYIAVDQWQQPDTDLVAYWTRKESQVATSLRGYRKIAITTRPNYFNGAADWEFTFDDDNGEKMHVRAVALVAPGNRGYGYLWATGDSIWQNNLPDFSRVLGSFRPAS